FLGSPAMNFFRGRLRADPAWRLETDRASLPLGDGAVTTAWRDACRDREIVLGLRPEHLELADERAPASRAQFDATLEVIEPVGNEIFLNLRFGEIALVARIAPRALPKPGGGARMQFDPACLHVFDAGSGERIETRRMTTHMHSAHSCA
ncbi:MAG TPA: TOBE domain-containing protein, partial [Rhodanobacteraceae bacterium]|nr:TOBE domain-containing protein [Rhodanobacteraceae bacterium]